MWGGFTPETLASKKKSFRRNSSKSEKAEENNCGGSPETLASNIMERLKINRCVDFERCLWTDECFLWKASVLSDEQSRIWFL